MGMLAFVSGILNYGVFPAISARFFIYFLDLPLHVHLGSVAVPTFGLVMASYLSCTVLIVLLGGQATMMITCCLEGLFSQLGYVIIAATVLYLVRWGQIVDVMSLAKPGKSPLNPFDTGAVKDFNVWFIVMAICTRVYSTMAMQQKQGFNSAARTPHESRMGGVLGEWRNYSRNLMILLLTICAMAYLRHPAFAQQAAPMQQAIASVGNGYLEQQVTVPIALRYLLPVGIKGLFLAVMVMGLFSGDGGHLHSWGSIFIQDVVLPLRRNPLSPKQHIWLLRAAITGVAVFAFFFSTYFPQTQYIWLWFLLTGALFTGGAGAAIIGGLYWKRGTTAAAWSAAITGSALGFTGIICGHYWSYVLEGLDPVLGHAGLHLPQKFWFNDQVSGFVAACVAATTYVVVSLVNRRGSFNLDRMLHRGQYAIASEHDLLPSVKRRFNLASVLRFDENFTFMDKIAAGGIFWWTIVLAVINIVVTVWNLVFRRWPLHWWANYWLATAIVVPFIVAAITLVWFTIGGLNDMVYFFRAMRTLKRDVRDDGRVVAHHNLADEPLGPPQKLKPIPS